MTLTPVREVLPETVVLCNVRRHTVQTASDARHTYWDESYGVPGLDDKVVKTEGESLLLK